MDKKKILKLYKEFSSVYGPYTRKDGRKHIVLHNTEKKISKTISYPKALMEIELGKKLKPNMTVDHIDRNFNNDSLDNLRVIDRAEHCSQDALRRMEVKAKCKW